MIKFRIDGKLWYATKEAPRGDTVEVRHVWRYEDGWIIKKWGNLGGVPKDKIREA